MQAPYVCGGMGSLHTAVTRPYRKHGRPTVQQYVSSPYRARRG